jgi:hypothetical protein
VLWLLGLLAYLAILRLEGMPLDKKETEVVVFSIFLSVWLHVIIFKKLFLVHGPAVIWQNIPKDVLAYYFAGTPIVTMVAMIGAVPLLYGMYAISQYLFAAKDRKAYLLIGIAIAVGLLLWLRLIRPALGLIVLGVVMTVLFSLFHQKAFDYISKTRFDRYKNLFLAGFLITISSTSIIPALHYTKAASEASVSQDTLLAMEWLRKEVPAGASVLTTPDEGHLVAKTGMRNVMDTNYVLIKGIDQRYEDVKDIYTALYETRAIKLLNKHDVDYILLTPAARKEFGVDALRFISDDRCFAKAFASGETEIYSSLCRI